MRTLRTPALLFVFLGLILLAAQFAPTEVAAVGNPINGSGTTGRICKFTGPQSIGNSVLREDSNSIGIGLMADARARLLVGGTTAVTANTPGPIPSFVANQNGAGPIADFRRNISEVMMIIDNSGNVGIGTNSPSRELDINGQVRIRGGSPQAGAVLTAINANGDAEWANPGSAQRVPITTLPLIISCPGSYYVAGSLVGTSGSDGILIDSNDVTLDLNGFDLQGVGGSLTGIRVNGSRSNISIRNGSIRGWGNDGVSALTAESSSFVSLHLSGNMQHGLVAGRGTVQNCTAYDNGVDGIQINSGSMNDCTAVLNGGDGFLVNDSCVVTRCTALLNADDGFSVNQDSFLFRNVSNENGSGGMHVTGGDNRIDMNFFEDNDTGILVDAPKNLLTRNAMRGDSQTSHSVVVGNKYGQFLDITAAADDLGTVVGAEHPLVNLIY